MCMRVHGRSGMGRSVDRIHVMMGDEIWVKAGRGEHDDLPVKAHSALVKRLPM